MPNFSAIVSVWELGLLLRRSRQPCSQTGVVGSRAAECDRERLGGKECTRKLGRGSIEQNYRDQEQRKLRSGKFYQTRRLSAG
jgi:hypothetical protein